MKKSILLLIMSAFIGGAFAQNVQLHYDFGEERSFLTSTVEMFKPDQWGNTFFFIDFDYSNQSNAGLAYWEIAREFKLGNSPLSAHIEYNGGIATFGSFGNAYLAGPSFAWNAEDFSKGFTLMAMYKLINYLPDEDQHNFQITAVWYLNFAGGKLSFTGFADFWKEKTIVSSDYFATVQGISEADFIFLSEPQLWYNVGEHFAVGGEIELGYNFGGVEGFKACPTLGAKWTF